MKGSGRSGPPRWPVALAWGVLLVAYLVAMRATGLGPLGALQALVALLADHPAGPLAFALAYVLRPLLLFSATVLTVGAGHLYGPWLGFLVVLVGANGGALLAYGLARWLSGPWATRLLASPRGGGLATRLRDRTFETVLTLRFLFAPYDAVNYLAGALRLRPGPFVLATALGSIPGSLTFLLFGASIGDLSALADGRLPSLDARALAASATLFVASLVASRTLRRRVARREAAAGGTATASTAAKPAAPPAGPTEGAP
jgi:uncharacterized membrane protein YdjX (TVP38/TMEM64 family)